MGARAAHIHENDEKARNDQAPKAPGRFLVCHNNTKSDTEANREKGRNARNYRAVNHHVDCTFSVLSAN